MRGERAKLSRWGEMERSRRRIGRGGIFGSSLPKEGPLPVVWSWVLAGRGGTWGIAVDIVLVVERHDKLVKIEALSFWVPVSISLQPQKILEPVTQQPNVQIVGKAMVPPFGCVLEN